MNVPEGMTPEKLREIAGWLDTYDRMAVVFLEALERGGSKMPEDIRPAVTTAQGKEVQSDLHAWADAIERDTLREVGGMTADSSAPLIGSTLAPGERT